MVVICQLYAVLFMAIRKKSGHYLSFCNKILPFRQLASGEVLPASMQQDVMQVHMVVPDRFLDVEEFPTALGGKKWEGTNRLQDKVVVKSFRLKLFKV